jgi:hypothetical protein
MVVNPLVLHFSLLRLPTHVLALLNQSFLDIILWNNKIEQARKYKVAVVAQSRSSKWRGVN